MPRESPFKIELADAEKTSLQSIAGRYTSPYCEVVRAKVILLASQGLQNKEIGLRLDLPRQIVSKWRKRFFEERLEGLHDQPRRGRTRVFSPSGRRGNQGPGV